MRMFANFMEAQNELRRDLNEMGTSVHPETMQDKYVADNPDFETKELDNYIYQVLRPNWREVEGIHEEWLMAEWGDRVQGDLNPGTAWKHRKEVWEQFLEATGPNQRGPKHHFSYTYSERIGGRHIQAVIDELAIHPTSRQLWIDMWRPSDTERRGKRRVPCTLGYWVVNRKGALNMTYHMRSCDLVTHFPNDVALATMLQEYIAEEAGLKIGKFTHWIGSLHVYARDVKDAF